MNSKSDDFPVKIGLSVWFCICVLIAIWVFTKFSNGRQQMYSNLHIVEESLRKMQEKIEMEQRKKSMGYVENLEDITACLERSEFMNLDNMTRPDVDGDQLPEPGTENVIAEEESEDKKHI
ncbi:uncharacterized protein LOC143191192 [Rhynchophorus ferrugineus]|uniref:Uncharacterized protein n=1 Tax=Rhynchophorus ferrugineus TaxID=354439 RepID=A0A834MJX7_RHYFE|nr:hypothetical protein GWI33_011719 [Rhynchophorus ferrugineus]